MLGLILVLGSMADDAAEAGKAYRQGLEELKKGRTEEAIAKFRTALQHEPKETAKLLYRDNEGRQSDPYYPHYSWAQACVLQAEREASAEAKRALLQESLAHLAVTVHAQAQPLKDQVKAALAKLEPAPVPRAEDPFAAPYAALRRKTEDLCGRARFEEALGAVEGQAALFNDHAAERAELLSMIRNRQKVTVESYERVLSAGLRTVSLTDPVEKPESVLPVLMPARIPREVQRDSSAPFRWLEEFLTLYEREIDRVRGAASLKTDQAVKTAEAFEAVARQALEAGSFAAFRAARNVARSVRRARLGAAGREDEEAVAALLSSWEAAARGWEADLRKRLKGLPAGAERDETQAYLAGELAAESRQADSARSDRTEQARGRERLERAIRATETALSDAKVMADESELKKVVSEAAALEADPLFAAMPGAARARALFARALADMTAGFLEFETDQSVAARCKSALSKAYALDPKVDAAWRERLSPRLLAVLDGLK